MATLISSQKPWAGKGIRAMKFGSYNHGYQDMPKGEFSGKGLDFRLGEGKDEHALSGSSITAGDCP